MDDEMHGALALLRQRSFVEIGCQSMLKPVNQTHFQFTCSELDRRRIVNTCSVVVVVVELDRRQLRLLVELDDCLQGYCCFAG
ncbi:hypothetical protein T4E_3071 [Trichinella pseudospiralis]|uniref:Uncharacterized protein n=1 Tax=Trichinella pseudospiralis TaxID=6337 RepID=A0A0V0XVC0_TRIPS|nr:hypothetical protein T4E_3071 [Trichinella pseudospiralis]